MEIARVFDGHVGGERRRLDMLARVPYSDQLGSKDALGVLGGNAN